MTKYLFEVLFREYKTNTWLYSKPDNCDLDEFRTELSYPSVYGLHDVVHLQQCAASRYDYCAITSWQRQLRVELHRQVLCGEGAHFALILRQIDDDDANNVEWIDRHTMSGCSETKSQFLFAKANTICSFIIFIQGFFSILQTLIVFYTNLLNRKCINVFSKLKLSNHHLIFIWFYEMFYCLASEKRTTNANLLRFLEIEKKKIEI